MHISSNSCRGYTRSQTSYVSYDYGLLTTVDKMIGHAKDWVQLCGKNRYKVIILIMHKGMRGKWDFIDMIKGGVACLADEVRVQGLQRRGAFRFRFHLYSTNNKQGSKVNTMHKH